jgi:hypothetical protein
MAGLGWPSGATWTCHVNRDAALSGLCFVALGMAVL